MHTYEEPVHHEASNQIYDGYTTHPSFGVIRAARVQGRTYLNGSDFEHNGFIAIEIDTAKMHHRNGKMYQTPDREGIVRLMLSEAQWATFVSSLNMGSGVPCTFTRLNGKPVPQLPPIKTAKQRFNESFNAEAKAALDAFDDLNAKIEALGLSKKREEELKNAAWQSKRKLEDSMPYLAETFAEHMEETVEKAKVEIHGYAVRSLMLGGPTEAGEEEPIKLAGPSDEA